MDPKRILVVDPGLESQRSIEEIFDLRGDQVIFAKDEHEAMVIFKDIEFDLVLIEVLLPRGSGNSLALRIRDHEKTRGGHTPVLLMGGVMRNFALAHEARIKYGADDVLVKPFELSDLRRKLAIHLDGIDPRDLEAIELSDVPGAEGELQLSKRYVEPVRLAGCLGKAPFALVLGAFLRLGETGVLRCQAGSVVKTLRFQDGKLIFVGGGNRRETLGWLLVREQLLDEPTLIRSLNRMMETGKKLGEVLIEQQAIGPHELFEKLRQEMEKKVLQMFRWTAGRYSFEPAVSVIDQDVVPLEIDVPQLLRRGVWQVFETTASTNAEFEPWLTTSLRKTPDAAAMIAMLQPNHSEKRLWDACDDETSLGEALDRTEIHRGAGFRFIYLALCVGAATMNAPKKPENPLVPAGDPEYRADIAQRFRHVYRVQLDQVLGEGDQPVHERHREACQGLFDRRVFSAADALTRRKAESVFERLEAACRFSARRTPPRVKQVPDQRTPRPKMLDAELHYQQGMTAFVSENFLHASDLFQSAIELDEFTADYHAYLGFSLYRQKGPSEGTEPTQAIRHLNRALALDPHLSAAHLFLGHIYWDLGQDKRAEHFYEKALAYDPEDRAALRQLRLLFANRKAAVAEDGPVAPPAPELVDYQRNIKTFFNRVQTADFFAVFGLDTGTPAGELKKVYFDLSAQLRSDAQYKAADPITREQADEIFGYLTVAYSTLTNPAERQAYQDELTALADGSANGIDAPPATREKAEEAFRRGLHSMRSQEFKNAVSHFSAARDLAPGEARYLSWLGFAKYQQTRLATENETTESTIGKEYLRRALAIQPGHIDASVLLGLAYLREGKRLLAEEQFDNALLADPNNIEALKAYRRIHSQVPAGAPVSFHSLPLSDIDLGYIELSEMCDGLETQDLFTVLDLTPQAGAGDIEAAYQELTAKFAFDTQGAEASPATVMRLECLRNLVERAFHVLTDAQLRECYEAALAGQPATEDEPAEPEAGEAEDGSTEAAPEPAAERTGAFWQRLRNRFGKGE